ncbi:hypothetical protein [Spirosoma linguale]|uniref:Uncharacterized protein n=1 Tax=Spirosoma linguale (strain ATCC 33905 / DSM 74 / LMG 10896 / Claus 1) TaxID=504472 RepID=D2QGY3_SPILD|nr:hypothetical protein Slin_0686 [Spirosoma linguale DSM 74]
MKKPVFPKNKTEKSMQTYEKNLDKYNKLQATIERLKKKRDKVK